MRRFVVFVTLARREFATSAVDWARPILAADADPFRARGLGARDLGDETGDVALDLGWWQVVPGEGVR